MQVHVVTSTFRGLVCASSCARTSASVPVIAPGPPSPPDSVTVEEVTDSTAQLAWSPGRDNGSPITNYLIQTRTPFTVGWQRVNTGRQRSEDDFSSNTGRDGVQMDPRGEIFLQLGGQSVGSATERRALQMGGIQGLTRENERSSLLLFT